MKNKILITGVEGFIGRNLVNTLKEEYQILTFNESDLDKDWKAILKSIFEDDIVGVFHVGACSDTLEQDVNYMMLLNYEVTKYITDLCYQYHIPLVYSSSAANYGVNGEYPSNLYGWSKYAGEGYVTAYGGIALRYFNVYGPGEEDKGRMASVAYQMYKRNQNGEDIKLFPKKPLRDFVYVKDIVNANIYAFRNCYEKLLAGDWYEVGSGEARGFEDKLDIMGIPYTYHPESMIPKGYQFYTCSNPNQWMEGWIPQYNLESGLKDYVEYLDTQN
jgi:ADP-L-glycero-D-manno-heptose 6-epimerase